jgi:catechol 2,3-dioxygenase-like lactoylglutathione lyase family enzyme
MKETRVIPILNVSSIEESFDWFSKLGWRKGWEWGEPPSFGGVELGHSEIFLCRNAQGGRGKGSNQATFGVDGAETADKGAWIYVMIQDVEAVSKRCVEHGLEITWPPTDMPWGLREMHVRHPDGHVLRIGERLEEE